MKRKFHEGREAGMNVSSTIRDSHRGRDEGKHPMGRKAFYARRRARGAILATLATLMSMLVASIGAASAQADGVGTATARGTDPDAVAIAISPPQAMVLTAEYSAITNCDEASNTRPFIVRASIGAGPVFFRRTSTATSTCHSENGANVNEGTGAGTWDGTFPATLSWRFQDSPDNVEIEIVSAIGALSISGAPQPLNGSPGGVWAFGTLPWPAGT